MEKSFSLFANFKQTTPSEITLDRVYRLITTDSDLRDRTEKFRFYLRVGNKQMSACEKTSCPAFTPAVRCEGGRKRMHIKAYTGLSLCDLDHIPEERMAEAFAAVCADPHVLLAYHTISGRGLRVIYAFLFEDGSSVADADPADRKTLRVYQEGYRQGNELFARLAGLEYDSSCKNPERISGTAYDPDAYYNPDAVAIRIEQPLQMPDGGDLKIVPSPVRDPLEMMAPGADRNGQIATLFSVILMEMTRRFSESPDLRW